MTLSAETIARALGLPAPTADQRAVIEAPASPALVVAGAGSGKTETMAGRVVWLVANDHVAPDEVLGLTFTRKAAGELAERIGRRLAVVREYARRDLLPHLERLVADGTLPAFWETHAASPPRVRDAAFASLLDRLADALVPARSIRSLDGEELAFRPRVATYNAFADALVREHGARIGRDPDSALLSQSGSWLLARRVVIASGDERLAEREEAFSTVVDAVHRLSGDVLDNRVDLDDLIAFADTWDARLSTVTCRRKVDQDRVDKARRSMTGLPVLAELVREYARRKRADDTLDFADQVADALTIVERAPEVGEALRAQYRVVLLDEYQDTSVLQTRLLAAIFRDTAVMAVGDPHQSIYGWRGASADNLIAFPSAFSSTGEAERFRLMISWRNDVAILTAANALLSAADGADVDELAPRPGAAPGRVSRVFAASAEDEAREVAEWFVAVRAAHTASGAPHPHSGAVLFRTKRHMQLFADALDAAGVPNRILGLGGLLSTPEVVDVVSALRVVHDPAQGSSLIRLLAGPRFSIGVADLAALHALADTLSRRDAALDPLPAELAARVRASAGADEQLSIIDALEFVRRSNDDHGFLRDITPEGRRRLRDAGEMFERLRRAVGQPIPDLLRLIEIELRLDIELAANEARGPARVASARLRTFLDEVRAFLLADDRGSVGSLLAWLDHAEETDELMPRPEPPEPGVVQLLTVHGSKGLEWDAVAVVRLVDKELPKAPRTVNGWLGFGVLPYPLRGDRDALPRLDWSFDDDDADLPDAIEQLREADRAHQEREERRLAYVAVTRARSELLLTGAHWAGQKEPRTPSRYLVEMLDALGAPPIEESAPDDNPYLDKGGRIVQWPLDPLGARREAVLSAADAVRAAADHDPVPDDTLARLLAEWEQRRRGAPVRPPARIPASRFKDYVTDYRGTVSAVTRPLPERPFRQTRLGTLFHAWVEQRSGRAGTAGSIDDALWEIDDDGDASEASASDAADLARLKEVFERSEWADLAPLEVETEIDFAMSTGDGEQHVMICKLDAVYRRADRGGRLEIVDWKTGRAPISAAEKDERMLQLALYRLAYHKKHGVPLDDIDVALYYVADDLVIRSDRVWEEAELVTRWRRARDTAGGRTQVP
ncbi:ATP-dependent DNA helicase [Microbacterium sp. Gd 4-13]|uniref:ATP-dependent DNA helicase n=1 Tax=Microbacterium sp. Gd 4-13 TaxID=2173179 RepID=UPI000D570A8E|nr:ATP-dependent DNA helicase [Microbacterium sp. Gd 4-13]PVW06303.1 ATP-dependent DNA helicase [Microbacterium sp. Gd 4-13]